MFYAGLPNRVATRTAIRRINMGRPVNKRNFGNTSASGQQIALTAYIPNDPGTVSAYVIAQKGSHRFNVANSVGTSSGLVHLVNGGISLTAGEANISVTPFGSTGINSAATAGLGLQSVAIGTSAGSGTTAHWYVPGEILTPLNGTATATGNILVGSVTLGAIVAGGGSGPGYTVGDTFTWGYAGYNPAPVVTVASITGNGLVNGLTISTAGVVTNVSVTNTTAFTSSTQTNAWATGASFTERWDLNAISIVNPGNYTAAIPANPVATTGSTHGTGANVTVGWEVTSVNISNGGTLYQSVSVAFSGSGGAAALGTVNAAGSVSSVTVTAPGSYNNTPPTVSFPTIGTVQYAKTIKNRTVETFTGNSYEWVDSATTPVDGQAQLQTS